MGAIELTNKKFVVMMILNIERSYKVMRSIKIVVAFLYEYSL